ncbi:MAG: response regulator [bacterium]|nr:response regulator [bacterium]
MKIMIVDDSEIIRKAIRNMLAGEGRDFVGEAGDGVRALEVFKDTKPEIVTMDITMPDMDGLECIRQMMAINPTVKILVVSAVSLESVALEALELGARSFLRKPFSRDQLAAAFEKIAGA